MHKVALVRQRSVLYVPEAYKLRGIPRRGGGQKTGEHGIRVKRAVFSRIKDCGFDLLFLVPLSVK